MPPNASIFSQAPITPIHSFLARPPRKRASQRRLDPYDIASMATPIPYAPPLPWHRRRRTQTLIVRLVLVAALTCGSIWTFRLIQQIQFLIAQYQAMHYSMPATRVVLAEGTADAPQLLANPAYRKIRRGPFDSDSSRISVAANPPTTVGLLWARSDVCVFLHARRVPGHHERLLSVTVDLQRPYQPGFGYNLCALAQVPANLVLGSRPTFCSPYGNSGQTNIPFTDSLRLFAGQPDPTDESHFTIRCEVDGKSEIIDGYLMPDDTVQLQLRK